ncbi:MAG: hypothetical protein HYR68_05385 [Burkholderiales bacterium]|nr:hypothetical protein [Burkholderiales bacterium]
MIALPAAMALKHTKAMNNEFEENDDIQATCERLRKVNIVDIFIHDA